MHKSIIFTSLATASMLLLLGCTAPQESTELTGRVDTLEKELNELKDVGSDKVNIREFFEKYYYNGQIDPTLALRYVKSIAPPENPTSEQIKEYLQQVGNLGNYNYNYQNIARSEIISQVKKFGHAHLEDLIPFMDRSDAIREAVRSIITPEDKPLIVKYLKTSNSNRGSYQLVEIYKNMIDDSDRETLLELLPNNPNLLQLVTDNPAFPPEVLLPIVTKKVLTGNRFNNQETWLRYTLNNLDDQPRKEFMSKFWRKARTEDGNNRSNLTNTAMQLLPYGYMPAFEFMAQSTGLWNNDTYRTNNFLSFTPAGSVSEFEKWYDSNKDNIVFDEETGNYAVPKK